jgi:hypothetical protein
MIQPCQTPQAQCTTRQQLAWPGRCALGQGGVAPVATLRPRNPTLASESCHPQASGCFHAAYGSVLHASAAPGDGLPEVMHVFGCTVGMRRPVMPVVMACRSVACRSILESPHTARWNLTCTHLCLHQLTPVLHTCMLCRLHAQAAAGDCSPGPAAYNVRNEARGVYVAADRRCSSPLEGIGGSSRANSGMRPGASLLGDGRSMRFGTGQRLAPLELPGASGPGPGAYTVLQVRQHTQPQTACCAVYV